MSEHPERELVELAQGGDRAAIGELFSRFWRAARAAAFGVTGDWASAEDAAAEGFCQALTGIGSLHDPAKFPGWLRAIVVRKAYARVPAAQEGTDTQADPHPLPDETLERAERAAIMQLAMRQLSEASREAIALFYFEGYDTDAAAQFLDIPPGTLRRRLHDARSQLRAAVEEILTKGKPMNNDHLDRFKTMLAHGDIYQAMRETLALRPPSPGLRDVMPQPPARDVSQLLGGPFQQSDLARQIHEALPEFQEARLTRGLVRQTESGETLSIYQHLQASPDEAAFVASRDQIHLVEVLDLTWMSPATLELRSVQDALVRACATVAPGTEVRISPYDEPRYRAALQLHFADVPQRAALGGVLRTWSGCPEGMTGAHIRIFLETWA